jgi:hypothetical protein
MGTCSCYNKQNNCVWVVSLARVVMLVEINKLWLGPRMCPGWVFGVPKPASFLLLFIDSGMKIKTVDVSIYQGSIVHQVHFGPTFALDWVARKPWTFSCILYYLEAFFHSWKILLLILHPKANPAPAISIVHELIELISHSQVC